MSNIVSRNMTGADARSQEKTQARSPGSYQAAGQTEVYTLFTQFNGPQFTKLLFSAQSWVRITLRLETAGPVEVGWREDLAPVLSGKGILLDVRDVTFILPKGQRLFYTAASVNRVRVIIEPIPWLEQILANVQIGFDRVVDSLNPLNLLNRMLGRPGAGPEGPPAPGGPPRQSPHEPCPPPQRRYGRR